MKRIPLFAGLLLAACAAPSPHSEARRLHHEAADALSRAKDPQEALRLLDESLELRPDSIDAWMLRGGIHRILGDAEAAVADYERVVELHPKHAAAHYNLGLLHADAGRHALAEKAFGTAIEIFPNYVEAYLHRSDLRRAAGRPEEAEKDLEEARRVGARMADRFFTDGLQEYNRGNQEKAVRALSFALALRPGHVEARLMRGAIYMLWTRAEEALADFDRAVKEAPQNEEAGYYRANALLMLDRRDDAMAELDRTLELRPDYVPGYVLRGILKSSHAGDPDAAEADLKKAVELDPKSEEAFEALGLLYQDQEMYGAAERELLKSLTLRATPQRLHLLAKLYRNMERDERAVEAYRLAIRICRDEAYLALLRKELEEVNRAEGTDEKRDP